VYTPTSARSAPSIYYDRMLSLRVFGDDVRFTVRVRPRARVNAIDGVVGHALKVRLTAPPVDGAANDALIAFLAARLGIAKSTIRLVAGQKARDKVVAVRGLSADAVRQALKPEGTARTVG
jgi:uncharacterized protein (TIGR00251 family)